MKRSKARASSARGERCPYCGTFYRHGSMARHCLKTPVCRHFNAPGSHRRATAYPQIQLAAFVCVLVESLESLCRGIAPIHARIKALSVCIDLVYAEIRWHDHVGITPFRQTTRAMCQLIGQLWPSHDKAGSAHLFAIAGSLVCDLRFRLGPFWQQHPRLRAPACWRRMEHLLDSLFTLYNPSGEENYDHVEDVPRLYETLYTHIWPEVPRTPDMRLYLAGDRFWLAATSKAEARDVLRRETGLVALPIAGIALGEKMEDGRTGRELLSLAGGRPGIIALAQ